MYVLEKYRGPDYECLVLNCSLTEALALQEASRKANPYTVHVLNELDEWVRLKAIPSALVRAKTESLKRKEVNPLQAEPTLLLEGELVS